MNNALIVSQNNLDVMLSTATTLVKSGLMPYGVNTPEKVVVIMMAGQELGIGPIQALNGIDVIQGKPTIKPQLMLALIYDSGKLEKMTIKGDETQCTVTMKRKGQDTHSETFTMADANKMITTEKDSNGNKKTIPLSQKFNWKSMPATMLKWRAVSACARVVFPDVIMGFYTTEEIHPDVPVDEQGEVVDSTAEVVTEVPQDQDSDVDYSGFHEEASGENEKPIHWIDRNDARKAFWRYSKDDLHLSETEVYKALGVDSIHKFDGTMLEAKQKLIDYADLKSNGSDELEDIPA